jgi:hypothetical protein
MPLINKRMLSIILKQPPSLKQAPSNIKTIDILRHLNKDQRAIVSQHLSDIAKRLIKSSRSMDAVRCNNDVIPAYHLANGLFLQVKSLERHALNPFETLLGICDQACREIGERVFELDPIFLEMVHHILCRATSSCANFQDLEFPIPT